MTQAMTPSLSLASDLPLTESKGRLEGLVEAFQAAHESRDERGAARALEGICRLMAPEIGRFCAYISGPRVSATDAAQEALLEACRRLPSLRDPRVARSWMYSIARNKVLAARRWVWVQRWVPGERLDALIDPAASPYQRIVEGRRARLVEEVLERMPEEHRTVIALHDLSGLSDGDVAEVLGKKKTNIKSTLRRARESFRRIAGELGCLQELSEKGDHDDAG